MERRQGPRDITSMPLTELWDDAGPVPAQKVRDLSAEDIRELLRQQPIRFVVANVGSPPRWVPLPDTFAFWKSEVVPHLAESDQTHSLDDFPGSYFYFADEWRTADGSPVVVLTMCH